MTGMVERVARALAGHFGPEFDKLLDDRREVRKWGQPGDNSKDDFLAAARAAIEAMREPTEGQYDAPTSGTTGGIDRASFTFWQTSIDAALNEPDQHQSP